jgi:hypothetical protein
VEWNQGASKISNMPLGLVEGPLASQLVEDILVSGHLIRDLEVSDRPRMLLMRESMECGAHPWGLLGDTVGFGECERMLERNYLILLRHWKGVKGRGSFRASLARRYWRPVGEVQGHQINGEVIF